MSCDYLGFCILRLHKTAGVCPLGSHLAGRQQKRELLLGKLRETFWQNYCLQQDTHSTVFLTTTFLWFLGALLHSYCLFSQEERIGMERILT